MFISNLSSEQQSVFLGLAKHLIEADDCVTPEETALLTVLQQQMPSDVTPKEVVVDSLGGLFQCKKSKASLLLELLGVAYADQEYHLTERDFICTVATQCGVQESELRDMESWVVRQLALVREAAQFMEA